MNRLVSALAVVLALGLSSSALGQGFVMPPDGGAAGSFSLESQEISIDIDDGIASYQVDQVFRNNTNEPIEAEYFFPLPEEASLSEFSIWMEGEQVVGDLLAKGRAREVFEAIVRKLVDPGVLEYADQNLIQARIFPIPAGGTQRVQVQFQSLISERGTIGEVRVPLWAPAALAGTSGEMTIHVELPGELNPSGIYSPSHPLDIRRRADRLAVEFNETGSRFDQDFWLYYTLDEEPVGLELMTYQTPGDDGYFMLLAAPGDLDAAVAPRDVTFVVDTSGSMAGPRLREIQAALTIWLQSLSPEDRFNIVQFANAVDAMSWEPVPATEPNILAAHRFVDEMAALGGTNLYEALDTALAHRPDAGRQHQVVMLTDGRPTVGVTAVDRIVERSRELIGEEGGHTRVFSLGIGHEVNTKLLGTLAADNRGFVDYVTPGEDLEMAATALYRQISHPVLTDLRLEMGDALAYDIYPRELPDLYSGTQLIVMGRYAQLGQDPVILTGRAGDQLQLLTTTAGDSMGSAAGPFIPRLWASRKVGTLLDQIRRDGESPDLVAEVVAMSAQYGIMTPYTSFLSTEEGDRPDDILRPPTPSIPVAEVLPPVDLRDLARSLSSARCLPTVRDATRDYQGFHDHTGEAAIRASEAIAALQNMRHTDRDAPMRIVDSRVFWLVDGVWIDDAIDDGMDAVALELGSRDYFDLLWDRPELQRAAALGTHVMLATDDGRILVLAPAA